MKSGNMIESEIDAGEAGAASSNREQLATKVASELDPDIFGDLQIELEATLGRGEMTVSELVNFTAGSILPLDTPLNGLVDLHLNGRIVARGEIVSVGDQFGVRISEIVARK